MDSVAQTKVCDVCGVAKPATTEYFKPHSSQIATLRKMCRDCGKAQDRERWAARKGGARIVTPDAAALPAPTPPPAPLALVPENVHLLIDPEQQRVNLTAMWRASGEEESRKPGHWVKTQSAQDFIAALVETETCIKNTRFETREGRTGSTWAHWQVGVEYARYLSPAFAIRWNEYARQWLELQRAAPAEPQVAPAPTGMDLYRPVLDYFTSTGTQAQTLTRHFQDANRFMQAIPAVAEELRRYLDVLTPLSEAVKQRRNPLTHGWIYVLCDVMRRPARYKIGMTQKADPTERQREVEGQWGKGQSQRVIWIETDDVRLERQMHNYYRRRDRFTHLGDEWYRLSPDDLRCLEAIGPFLRCADFSETLLAHTVIEQFDMGLEG